MDGRAVGLHYQGLYLVNNDAVPTSIIDSYLKERPWQGDGRLIRHRIIDAIPKLTRFIEANSVDLVHAQTENLVGFFNLPTAGATQAHIPVREAVTSNQSVGCRVFPQSWRDQGPD
jgi:hypothetical protein